MIQEVCPVSQGKILLMKSVQWEELLSRRFWRGAELRSHRSSLTELQGEIYPQNMSSQRLWAASPKNLLENGIFSSRGLALAFIA